MKEKNEQINPSHSAEVGNAASDPNIITDIEIEKEITCSAEHAIYIFYPNENPIAIWFDDVRIKEHDILFLNKNRLIASLPRELLNNSLLRQLAEIKGENKRVEMIA